MVFSHDITQVGNFDLNKTLMDDLWILIISYGMSYSHRHKSEDRHKWSVKLRVKRIGGGVRDGRGNEAAGSVAQSRCRRCRRCPPAVHPAGLHSIRRARRANSFPGRRTGNRIEICRCSNIYRTLLLVRTAKERWFLVVLCHVKLVRSIEPSWD